VVQQGGRQAVKRRTIFHLGPRHSNQEGRGIFLANPTQSEVLLSARVRWCTDDDGSDSAKGFV
jgi:hypothetical protein